MSHFTVLVVGSNPEEQLAPYDENIRMPRYKVGEVSEEDIKRFREYYLKSSPEEASLSLPELYDLHGEDWDGKAWEYEDGKFYEYSTYNPDSQWDWYRIGGRWAGFFKMKPGKMGVKGQHGLMDSCSHDGEGYADQALKGDIDFEGMRADRAKELGEEYDKVMALVGNLDDFISWPKLREKHGEHIDAAREEYRNQRAVKAISTQREYAFCDLEDFQMPREEYIDLYSSPSTFAVLKDGKWYEKGKMGWWAIVSDPKDEKVWKEEFKKLLNNLSDDTLLTVVDCHI